MIENLETETETKRTKITDKPNMVIVAAQTNWYFKSSQFALRRKSSMVKSPKTSSHFYRRSFGDRQHFVRKIVIVKINKKIKNMHWTWSILRWLVTSRIWPYWTNHHNHTALNNLTKQWSGVRTAFQIQLKVSRWKTTQKFKGY